MNAMTFTKWRFALSAAVRMNDRPFLRDHEQNIARGLKTLEAYSLFSDSADEVLVMVRDLGFDSEEEKKAVGGWLADLREIAFEESKRRETPGQIMANLREFAHDYCRGQFKPSRMDVVAFCIGFYGFYTDEHHKVATELWKAGIVED